MPDKIASKIAARTCVFNGIASTGIWYLLQRTAGFGGVQRGIASDTTVPSVFIP